MTPILGPSAKLKFKFVLSTWATLFLHSVSFLVRKLEKTLNPKP